MIKRIFIMVWLLLASSLGAVERGGARPRNPIPEKALQREAETLIREFFKDVYAGSQPNDRVALAQRLIKEARETNTDMELKYVLLCEARKAALEAGHVQLAMEAIEHTGQAFEYDAFKGKTELLKDLAGKSPSPEASMVTGEAILALIDQCIDNKQHEQIADWSRMAVATAQKTNDTKFKAKVQWLAGAYTTLAVVLKALEQDPRDPESNLKLGRYYCFYRNAWDRGLPLLAQGRDEELRELAQAELNGPDDAEDRYELAHAWRKYSKDLDEKRRFPVWEHAVYWYQKALPGIEDEEDRVDVRERIADFFRSARQHNYLPTHVTPKKTRPAEAKGDSAPKDLVAGLSLLKYTAGRVRRQNMTGFKAGTWTNDDQLWWTGGKIGDSLSLGVKVPEKKRYAVKAILTKAHDYGIVQFFMDGEKLGKPFDGYGKQVINTPWTTLGVVKLKAGHHVLMVKIVGTHPVATRRYMFGIDELKLEPLE